MKHEVSALVEYAIMCARVHCTTGGGLYEDIMRHPLTATLFNKYSVRKGIKVFGEAGITAVKEELQQLETRKLMQFLIHRCYSGFSKYFNSLSYAVLFE